MLSLTIWALIFVASMAVLVKASDWFTDSAEEIGVFFGLPVFVIGITIVALGTSLPELVSSVFAVLNNSSEIVVGNVLGSNIANIFLVLGVTAIVGKKLKITYELIHVDLPFLVGSSFLLGMCIFDMVFTFSEALLCIVGFFVYSIYTITSEEEHKDKEIIKEIKIKKKKKIGIKPFIVLFFSAIFIYLGAKYTIESVINLSEMLNIGKEIIALSAIALGTSLPELAVSINAARKNKPEIAVGNVLGSNIFNVLFVMGVPAMIGNLVIPRGVVSFSLPIMLIATLLYFFMTQDNELTKWEGFLLLLFYVFFIGSLFSLF